MFNSICERRMQSKGMYAVILQIPEDEYFTVYDTITDLSAKEIVENYLNYRGDDGRPEKISINHDPTNRLVSINLYLYYTGNDHTEIFKTPQFLNATENDNLLE